MKRFVALRSVLGLTLFAAALPARSQDAPAPMPPPPADQALNADNDISPYHLALVAYKTGDYAKARQEIDQAEKDRPGIYDVDLLKARILTEQKDFAEGEKILRSLLAANPAPAAVTELQLALGDLFLRKHSFDRAAKYYGLALQAKPKDPDILLKLVYAKIGTSDLVAAGNYASQLSPMDPKNPYDDHASYYFARAALAQATGNSQGADDDIQTARTIYGITVTNRYMRTYLQVSAPGEKNPDLTPAPIVKPATNGATP